MSSDTQTPAWTFKTFGLFVTGKGEEEFAPALFRSLTESGDCTFTVRARFGQRSPITSEKRLLRMVGEGKKIPNRDAEEIGLPARRFLESNPNSFVILIDDLEEGRRDNHAAIFSRYEKVFDTFLSSRTRPGASVHFFVNMLEAYYFADIDPVNSVLNTSLSEFEGDVEEIKHPKNALKRLTGNLFDENRDGRLILNQLNLTRVLRNGSTCRSLRSLIKWCIAALRQPYSEQYSLLSGECCLVTMRQIADIEGHIKG